MFILLLKHEWAAGKPAALSTMKTNNAQEENDALREILRAWQIRAPLPRHFRETVWRRIEQEEAKSDVSWATLRAWIEGTLPRAKIALCYVTVQLFLGMTIGVWMARQQSSRMDAALGSRYVQSVDPYRSDDSNQ